MTTTDKTETADKRFTIRKAAKYAVKAAITMKATSIAKDLLIDYTSFDDDGMTVKIGSKVVGMYVGSALEPVTDKIVDTTADFAAAKIAERKLKRQDKTDVTEDPKQED